jgi:DNA-directed RNA polymerase specialized sigma54-like protein
MKLGHELGLLVMTPQLQQAIDVLRLSLPELNELVTRQLKKEGKRKA